MAGWKQNVTRGKTIWVLEQSGEWACGMCCAGMALRWTGNGNPTEDMLASASRKTGTKGQRYEYAIQDRPDMVATPLVGLKPKVKHKDVLDDPGTTAQGVTDLLNGYQGITAVLTRGPSAKACKDACRATADDGSRAVIIGLVNPPHFVICHSHVRRLGDYTIHLIGDPGSGDVVEGHITDSGGMPYLATSDGRYGTIIDEMIVIS
jgi:hypothetical protein